MGSPSAFQSACPWLLSDCVPTQPEQPALQIAALPPLAAAAPTPMQHNGTAGIKNSTAAAALSQGIPAHWGSQAEHDTGPADLVGMPNAFL